MTLTWIGACAGVMVAIGDETVSPAVAHTYVANEDSIVGWWRSACCIMMMIVGGVGSSSGVGTMKTSSLGSKSTLTFPVGCNEVCFEQGERLVSFSFLTPRQTQWL
jgi:hypothetical protein